MPPSHKPRVFLDTNVIFSGLYSPSGAPSLILRNFINGDIDVVISQQVLKEIIRTFEIKLPEALLSLNSLLINSPPEITADPDPGEIEKLTQKLSIGDAAILGAAIAAQPDYFITGDNHFLKNAALSKDTGLNIVTPAKFLKITGLKQD